MRASADEILFKFLPSGRSPAGGESHVADHGWAEWNCDKDGSKSRICGRRIGRPRKEVALPRIFIGRYWRGEGPLWKVYWLYGVLGSSVLGSLIAASAIVQWVTPVVVFTGLAIGAIYTVRFLVSVWRCAFNITGEPPGMSRDGWAPRSMQTVAWPINVSGLAVMLLDSVLTR